MAKVNISPSKGWTVQPKKVNKKMKAKLNTAAQKSFFPDQQHMGRSLSQETKLKTFGGAGSTGKK